MSEIVRDIISRSQKIPKNAYFAYIAVSRKRLYPRYIGPKNQRMDIMCPFVCIN